MTSPSDTDGADDIGTSWDDFPALGPDRVPAWVRVVAWLALGLMVIGASLAVRWLLRALT